MTKPAPRAACLECGRESDALPLIALEYRSTRYWICPQHLPVLIHEPARLIGKLPGAEGLSPAVARPPGRRLRPSG